MIKIADLGNTFGMSGGIVFSPWDNANVVVPKSYGDFVDQIDTIDLVIFGGGADIHPSLYNHINVASHVGVSPSSRDFKEVASFKACVAKKIPVFGICRGAQLACALSGGFLIQNLSSHAGGDHNIVDKASGSVYDVTSLHHQMMWPGKAAHELIAVAQERLSGGYDYDVRKAGLLDIREEPEIVYFSATKSLGVQGHPEFMDPDSKTVTYIRSLVNKYLLNGAYKDGL